MTNGVGTWFCRAGFDIGSGWDDAVECAMVVFFPVWALRVVHVREIPGGSFAPSTYEAMPLRWSDDLVYRVFLRRWFGGLIGLGVMILLILGLVHVWPPTGYAEKEFAITKPYLTPLAPLLIVGGAVGRFSLRRKTRRDCDIRCLLGQHSLGTSDPASWVPEDLARFGKPDSLFGTPTYADAVPKLLAAGAWSGAIWAARLSTAAEGEPAGEALTDQVLLHPSVVEAIARYRRDPKAWALAVGTNAFKAYRAGLIAPAEPGLALDHGSVQGNS
jgi:hypothetical protein